jgi:hypothetical protein
MATVMREMGALWRGTDRAVAVATPVAAGTVARAGFGLLRYRVLPAT